MTTQTIEPTLPRYAESCLDAFSTSMLASLGVPGEPNPLRLAPAERVCLLLIDGLGWDLLSAHPAAAPFLSELAMTAAPLTAGFPATTVTSLATLGTGRPPGQHGLLGYQVAIPGSGRLLNALRWDDRVDPVRWQPGSTIFERAASSGVRAYRVAPAAFRKSGLSLAAMRGAGFLAADTIGALISRTASALAEAPPALASVYYGDLDSTGHALGCGSDAWQYELAHVDKLAEQLAAALPHGTVLHVTADHGMVDVSPGERIDVDALPQLREGVALLGGEPRARHVYCQPGAADDVQAAWSEVLGDRFWVTSRERAVADGWFGPVDDLFAARIGDVLAAPSGPSAIVATKAEPRESALIGLHGSLTQSDQLVPLLTLAVS
ncbi:MAG TPA: nucleotide pyrophosphatase/phosphodiesterase family protein [Streptosporangiaceae bacterium]|nr:nucleotide pyrophosphatase/phosphodiesterase family protein [Streptosporangiaceae bacterium]